MLDSAVEIVDALLVGVVAADERRGFCGGEVVVEVVVEVLGPFLFARDGARVPPFFWFVREAFLIAPTRASAWKSMSWVVGLWSSSMATSDVQGASSSSSGWWVAAPFIFLSTMVSTRLMIKVLGFEAWSWSCVSFSASACFFLISSMRRRSLRKWSMVDA